MDALVYGARLEQVVALVRSAPGIEEGEHARYEKRRFVVRYGVGAGQYAACLAVVAVASGEEERIGRREGRGTGGIPEETALGDRPVVDDAVAAHDEVAHLHAGAYVGPLPRMGGDRPVAEERCPFHDGIRPDGYVSQYAARGDTGAGPYRAERRCRGESELPFRHAEQPLDGGRPVAVHGDDVGELRSEPREERNLPAAGFVHRRCGNAAAEAAAPRGLHRRSVFHRSACADVASRQAPDVAQTDARADANRSAETAAAYRVGREVRRYIYRIPILCRAALCLQSAALVGGQFPVIFHKHGRLMRDAEHASAH